MKRNILLTGFKPFLNEAINPSEQLVQKISQTHSNINSLVLPVSYQRSFEELKDHWESHGPYKGILMLGQAAGRSSISLERVALNWSESSLPDEDGHRHPTGPLIPGAPTSYISNFFSTDWIELLNTEGATSISFSAGTYVCNSLYYNTLHKITQNAIPTLFVHVPYLPEQIVNKPGAPAIDFHSQFKVISKILDLMQNY